MDEPEEDPFPPGMPVEVEHPPPGVPAPWRSDWVWSPGVVVGPGGRSYWRRVRVVLDGVEQVRVFATPEIRPRG